jgi:hypothetical protein
VARSPEPPRDATAYPGREVAHNIIIAAAWLADQDDTVGTLETGWARGFLHALHPKAVHIASGLGLRVR